MPSDWIEVAQLSHTFNTGTLSFGSLPTALRKAMISKFADFDEYQLGKYNKQKKKAKTPTPTELVVQASAASDDEATLEKLTFTLKQLIRKLHVVQPAKYVSAHR